MNDILEGFDQVEIRNTKKGEPKITIYETGQIQISNVLKGVSEAHLTLLRKSDKIALCISPVKSHGSKKIMASKGSNCFTTTVSEITGEFERIHADNRYKTNRTNLKALTVNPCVHNAEGDAKVVILTKSPIS